MSSSIQEATRKHLDPCPQSPSALFIEEKSAKQGHPSRVNLTEPNLLAVLGNLTHTRGELSLITTPVTNDSRCYDFSISTSIFRALSRALPSHRREASSHTSLSFFRLYERNKSHYQHETFFLRAEAVTRVLLCKVSDLVFMRAYFGK